MEILKCELVFKWEEPNVQDYIQYLTGKCNMTLEEAKRKAEQYCVERADKTLWAADNSLPDFDYYLKTEWVEVKE